MKTKAPPASPASLTLLLVALAAMFTQHTFTTVAKSAVPLVAPAALPELGVGAPAVGIYVALVALAQVFIVLGCGSILERHGGCRTTQVGLLLIAAGLSVAASGILWLFLVAALLVSLGTSVATPASSQVLARYTSPGNAPLVYSTNQASVPFGLMVAGLMIPAFVLLFGWKGALLATAVLCASCAVLLQPLRPELDGGRNPTKRFALGDVKSTFVQTVKIPPLRRIGLAALAFAGVQTSFISFYVLFLTEGLGYSLALAGMLFSAAVTASIPMRVFWGYVSSKWLSARATMITMSLMMAGSCVLVGLTGEDWAAWQVFFVAFLLTSTALSWAGVILAETVRMVPTHQAGRATGGVLGIHAFGHMLIPLAFSAILALTGSYALGFFFLAVPTLLAALLLLSAGRSESAAEKVSYT